MVITGLLVVWISIKITEKTVYKYTIHPWEIFVYSFKEIPIKKLSQSVGHPLKMCLTVTVKPMYGWFFNIEKNDE